MAASNRWTAGSHHGWLVAGPSWLATATIHGLLAAIGWQPATHGWLPFINGRREVIHRWLAAAMDGEQPFMLGGQPCIVGVEAIHIPYPPVLNA